MSSVNTTRASFGTEPGSGVLIALVTAVAAASSHTVPHGVIPKARPPPGPVQVHFTGARRSHPCSLAAPGLPFLACKYNRLLFDEEQGKDEAKTKIE